MIQLIYYSIASPSLNKEEIKAILKVSRQNNAKVNLTGCLLYYNDAFLQILEGSPEAVQDLYGRIEQDERHYNIKLVYTDDIHKRLFNNWSMGFYDLDIDDPTDKQKLAFRKEFLSITEQMDQSVASELFADIAEQLLQV